MKRFSMGIALLAGTLLMGCSKSEAPQQPLPDSTIRLYSGVTVTTGTRTPVAGTKQFTAQVCGWNYQAGATATLTEPADWGSHTTVTAGGAVGSILLNPVRNYEGEKEVAIRAWYPAVASADGTYRVTGGKVSFDNEKADIDVMITQQVSGSVKAPVDKPLIFDHLTTQLRFELVDDGWDADNRITALAVQGLQVPVGIDIVAGTLVTEAVAKLPVLDIPAEGLVPGTTPVGAGSPLLVAPVPGNTLKVDIVAGGKEFKDIIVTTADASYLAGRAYTVTLTFSGTDKIKVGSSVAEWTPGVGGDNIVN